MTVPPSLIRLLRSYTKAFDDFDAEAIAQCYCMPCAISDGDGRQVFTNRQELRQKFLANCAAFKRLGYQRGQFSVGNSD